MASCKNGILGERKKFILAIEMYRSPMVKNNSTNSRSKFQLSFPDTLRDYSIPVSSMNELK